MILINFSSKWDDKDGKYLEWKRIRWGRFPHAGPRAWTPFCHVWLKHHSPPKRVLQSRKLTLTAVSKFQQKDGNFNHDEYRLGLANGLIFAESIMNDRPPHFLEKPKKWLKKSRKKTRVKKSDEGVS